MFKRRTPEAILLTVPYTGTTFTRKLLETVDASNHHSWGAYIPHAHWLDENVAEDWHKISQTKAVITARDPYLSAIRCIKTKHESPIEFITDSWTACFKGMKELDYIILDVACPKEDRLNHVMNVINFIGVDTKEQHMINIMSYVEKWVPANESQSEYKTKYLESGKLPNGYDWNLLDNAAEWYNNLLTNNS